MIRCSARPSGAAGPVTEPATEPAAVSGAHATPDAFALVGGQCVLEAFLLNGADLADSLGRHRGSFIFTGREEDVGVGACAGRLVTPFVLRFPDLFVYFNCRNHFYTPFSGVVTLCNGWGVGSIPQP